MRELHVDEIIKSVRALSMETNYFLGNDVIEKMKENRENENSDTAKNVMDILLDNYEQAAKLKMPICQDTGISVIFVEIGQDLHIIGGDLRKALNEGVKQGYKDGFLRKSIVDDPVFLRKNTTDNTPAVIHFDIVEGDSLKITFAPKGGGSENMSSLQMMKPTQGINAIKKFVIDTVTDAGSNPCPPIVVGIGIGGTFERSAFLAKKSLMRELNVPHPNPDWGGIEEELLEKINKIGIGPQGLGGRTTALAVRILAEPCHIASMPVAINIQCHASRHKSIIL